MVNVYYTERFDMQANPLLGLFFHAIDGLAVASFYFL